MKNNYLTLLFFMLTTITANQLMHASEKPNLKLTAIGITKLICGGGALGFGGFLTFAAFDENQLLSLDPLIPLPVIFSGLYTMQSGIKDMYNVWKMYHNQTQKNQGVQSEYKY